MLHVLCLDQDRSIGLQLPSEIFPASFMLDPFVVSAKHFDRVVYVAAKMVFKRFLADRTWNGCVTILSCKQNYHSDRVVALVGIREDEFAIISHAEHTEYARDARELNILFTTLEAGNCRRADARERSKTLLS